VPPDVLPMLLASWPRLPSSSFLSNFAASPFSFLGEPLMARLLGEGREE
jgi:hypothetical protein